jgi:hypothetical protein
VISVTPRSVTRNGLRSASGFSAHLHLVDHGSVGSRRPSNRPSTDILESMLAAQAARRGHRAALKGSVASLPRLRAVDAAHPRIGASAAAIASGG